jgi:hypothetical protein
MVGFGSMSGYTKLFNSILASTVWQAGKETKILWITLLAMADKDGTAEASIPGLARIAGLSVEETERGLTELSSPDRFSRTTDHEGRRIEAIDGGWKILNHPKYREKYSADERREYKRVKAAEYRARDRGQRVESVSTNGQSRYIATTSTDTNVPPVGESVDIDEANRAAAKALTDALAEASRVTGLSGLEILAEPTVRGKGSPISNPLVCPTVGRKLWEVTADRVRGFAAARVADARDTARGRARKGNGAPSWDQPDAAEAILTKRAVEWIDGGAWPRENRPMSREHLASMLDTVRPPADIADRVRMVLYARNPQLRA